MNIKIRALLYTAGFIVGMSAISFCFVWALNVLSAQTIIWICSASGIGFLCYMMYKLILDKLEYDEKITEIHNNQFK